MTPSNLFDHRLCKFNFKRTGKIPKKVAIIDDAIKSPELERQSKLAALNVIKLYSIEPLDPRTLYKLDELNLLNHQIISLSKFLEQNPDIRLSNLLTEKQDKFMNMELDFRDLLDRHTFNISYTELLLMVINEIKLIAGSLSASIKKSRVGHIEDLKRRIKLLNHHEDYVLINELEDKLQGFINVESNVLHRKPTLRNLFFAHNDMSLMSATLKRKTSTPLTVLRDDAGNNFATNTDRNHFILSFYKKIYENEKLPSANISNFLSNIPEPAEMSANESENLCKEISDLELSKIIDGLGKTAVGIDGVPNLLIKNLSKILIPFMKLALSQRTVILIFFM